MDFEKAAHRAPEQTIEIFGGSLDSIVQEMGILDESQVQEGRERQAFAFAIRRARSEGLIDSDALPESNEKIDYLALATMDQESMLDMMKEANITDDRMDLARSRLASNGEINYPDNPNVVPYIGQVYREQFGHEDEIYGALIIQQAVRATQTAHRMQGGVTDPSLHDQKGEFWPVVVGEPDEVVDIIDAHFRLSVSEKGIEPGLKDVIDNEYIHAIDKAFDDATAFFERAGRDDLVRASRIIKQHTAGSLTGQELLPLEPPDEDVDLTQNDGADVDTPDAEGQHFEG